ncbi:DUF3071 domain-containing protein [Corynebacterium sp. sy017]|uniref:septation protein SepH n=1 Tax=unclassified Corynebacterium TaxID=2624378 RepID=UPI0011864C40|nr:MULTISPECIES: septation protein SepH [unclassified Corynebacterium]MBP3088796.1 DUF3071 domain-containing protein [Corynebacterium sp. sy017]TSD91139.1 DUF3071 domain-containing protein [Corynebacterium sp. SY003]
MRELVLISEESTRSSLVFSVKNDTDTTEQFFFAVDDSLRDILLSDTATTDTARNPEKNTPVESHETPAAATDAGAATEAEHNVPQGYATAVSTQSDSTAATPTQSSTGSNTRPQREVDPRLSTPLKMRPREIQDRIRQGATIEQVAEENDVTVSRIEPYAHPVLLERARIAEMAKQAHPVRDDGPATLTLWEILATAFAARDVDLSTCTWDAYRDSAGQWVVKVSWKAGLSENSAEWSYLRHGMSSATAVARNRMAADLTDPDLARPVRTLSPLPISSTTDEDSAAENDVPATQRTRDDIPVVSSDSNPKNQDKASASTADTVEMQSGEFLQHPDTKPATKRRRKAVTPHWEDVLLGVRANTKRPRK